MSDETRTTAERPAHPLVVDAVTGLCRYATQDDIRRLEAIERAFDAVVADARRIIVSADNLRERLQERLAND